MTIWFPMWDVEDGTQPGSFHTHLVERGTQPPRLDLYEVTPDSIAKAKAARDAERRQIEAATGVVISEDGHITKRGPINPWLAYGDAIAAVGYGVYGKPNN